MISSQCIIMCIFYIDFIFLEGFPVRQKYADAYRPSSTVQVCIQDQSLVDGRGAAVVVALVLIHVLLLSS